MSPKSPPSTRRRLDAAALTAQVRGPAVPRSRWLIDGVALTLLIVYCRDAAGSSTATATAGILGTAYLAAAAVRHAILSKLQSTERQYISAGLVRSPWRHYVVEMGTWGLAGALSLLALTVFHSVSYTGGLRMAAGFATVAFFAGSHASHEQLGRTYEALAERPGARSSEGDGFVSITRELVGFQVSVLIAICTILATVVQNEVETYEKARLAGRSLSLDGLVQEILAVNVILFLAGAGLTLRYTANLRRLFDVQLKALRRVQEGDYRTPVPILTRDEFSTIAAGTNEMMIGLGDRDRIRATFGRYVSPTVARAILDSEGGSELGGRQVDVCIMFCDLRNFTPLSERLAPADLVEFLNDYFTRLVEVVHAHGGVVDKFIGDAAMVVFGLDGLPDPCVCALDASVAIREQVARLNRELADLGGLPIDCGVGLHFGPVVAGNIGSPERLEYTVIGDTVNIASRLESASKGLGHAVVVSKAVNDRLDPGRRGRLVDLGGLMLKGKSEAIAVFGLVEASAAPAPALRIDDPGKE